ncbi:interferon-induced 35 kDa protein [Ambystoma mexicanum]|uniref:interferon-induced 35 kDa protein n=1 Tax=Ambystoma mexicanum TaxID=8296 RepID=UPI0037E93A4F
MEAVMEDFIYINAANATLTAEGIKKEIERLQAVHEQFEKDKAELGKARATAEYIANAIQDQTSTLEKRISEKKEAHAKLEGHWESSISKAQEESATLSEKRQVLERILEENERKMALLNDEVQVSSSKPERNVVFKGVVSEAPCKDDWIEMKPKIFYPMSGGTALITFEKAEVAASVIAREEHLVKFEECSIRVEASAVELPMPSSIDIDMQVCNCRILVSNLPESLPQESMLDKVELFLSKTRNGGGEVDQREFLPDSGNVVFTFRDEGVAKGLTKMENIPFPFENKTYQLKVTPYVKGEIQAMKLRDSTCLKTVQLTGIPDIMDEEAMQDVLEIHFQKKSNGGGQVEVVHYVRLGKSGIAVFEEDMC